MPRNIELTWFAPRKLWKKKFKGKVYYLGEGKSKTDWESYQKALSVWKALKTSLEANHAQHEQQQSLSEFEAKLKTQFPSVADAWINHADQMRFNAQQEKQKLPRGIQSVQSMLDRWIALKSSQAANNEKSNGRIINLKLYGKQFAEFVGTQNAINTINELTLTDWYLKASKEIKDETITAWCARDRMQVARQFITYCWGERMLELPRNINSKEHTISVPKSKIEIFPLNELKELIQNAPPLLRCWMLLMANCGFTQKDISDLKISEINIKEKAITRKRSKTQKHDNVPEVTYKLWDETFTLLMEHKDKGEYAFLNKRGGRLCYSALTAKSGKVDVISKEYNLYLKREEKEALPLKHIRKTSASTIAHHPTYKSYAAFFLGHSPSGTAEESYVKPSQSQFDKCVVWLGKQYGF